MPKYSTSKKEKPIGDTISYEEIQKRKKEKKEKTAPKRKKKMKIIKNKIAEFFKGWDT